MTSVVSLVLLALVSGLTFLHYGFEVLFRTASRGEFERVPVNAPSARIDGTQMPT